MERLPPIAETWAAPSADEKYTYEYLYNKNMES